MKLRSSLLACFFLFTIAHLLLIPVLAAYGVRVCPILRNAGFGFGCKYNGLFIIGLLVTNVLVNSAVWKWVLPRVRSPVVLQLFPFLSIFSYLGTFLVAAALLNGYLHGLNVSPASLERLNDAISYGAIILSVFQEQMGEWIIHDRIVTARKMWRPPSFEHPVGRRIRRLLEAMGESNLAVVAGLISGVVLQHSLHRLPGKVDQVGDWFMTVAAEFFRGFVLFSAWALFMIAAQLVRKSAKPASAGTRPAP